MPAKHYCNRRLLFFAVLFGCAATSFPAVAIEPIASVPSNTLETGRYVRHAMAHRGDPTSGRRLWKDSERTLCASCHKVRGEGADSGPDLSFVGGKLGREYLIESILEPSRQIVEGFRTLILVTTDGRLITGLLVGEADGYLTVLNAQAQRVQMPLDQIEERQLLDQSPMPERLASVLSLDEFTDLIAYLESLRSAGSGTPGSGMSGPISLPPGFEREFVAAGLTGVTALAIAPDGRIFVCEQTGALRVVKQSRMLDIPFAKFAVDDQWERGLIGVAVDPDFARNHFVYVNYVAREPYPHHRVSRLVASGDVAVPGSEQVLFEGDDQTKLGGKVPAGHQGGAIHFDRAGKLFVAFGEQTAEQPAQSLQSLLGKILRLNRDGSIPDDNPFALQTSGKYRAIWALGCRNPFTFAIEPTTGRMLINDVGGKSEEINEGSPGANYGWPAVEHGPTGDSRFCGPIHWYPTASISGGAYCPRGPAANAFPQRFQGRYFFMDFVQGWIKVLDPDSTQRPIPAELFAAGLNRPVDLSFAPDGSLYVLVRDAWVRDAKFAAGTGSLHRIRPTR